MHEELVNALRCCVTDYNSIQSRLCNKCQYAKYADGKYGCENKLKADAADALETSEKNIMYLFDRVCELEEDNSELKELVMVIRCKDCESWDEECSSGRKTLGNYRCICHEWSNEEDGHYRYTAEDDFCSYAERREE